MKTEKLLLIRHAASTGQAPDAALSSDGEQQAERLSDWLQSQRVDGLFASPYRRAVATLEPFAAMSGLPLSLLDGLRERVLSVTPRSDWRVHIQRSFEDRAYKLEGGESVEETASRALAALQIVAQHGCTRPAIASHGNLIASVLNRLDPSFGYDGWLGMANPDVFQLRLENGRPIGFERLAL